MDAQARPQPAPRAPCMARLDPEPPQLIIEGGPARPQPASRTPRMPRLEPLPRQYIIEDNVLTGCQEGLTKSYISAEKGFGVRTTRPFRKGAFLVEYHGRRYKGKKALAKEAAYGKHPETGSYMLFFKYKQKLRW